LKRSGGEILKIAVVDGQGGGIGRLIVEKLRQETGPACHIIGLGTNAIATSMMLKAGANEGASGQNAIVFSVGKVDIIVGSVAVLAANSYSGELTARMAEAIASADAVKILIPLNKCGIEISGVIEEPLPVQVDHLVNQVKNILQNFER
jgi:NAD(P)-dependent dehydrogenase (short-subunit alcohol dehydrogenase family)